MRRICKHLHCFFVKPVLTFIQGNRQYNRDGKSGCQLTNVISESLPPSVGSEGSTAALSMKSGPNFMAGFFLQFLQQLLPGITFCPKRSFHDIRSERVARVFESQEVGLELREAGVLC